MSPNPARPINSSESISKTQNAPYFFSLKCLEKLKKKEPNNYKNKNATKRLAAIQKIIFEIIPIPNDPTLPEYRLGTTLGEEHKHRFRVKFFQQYRLFFRFHKESKIIVFAWVNDENTKRAYDSKTDAFCGIHP